MKDYHSTSYIRNIQKTKDWNKINPDKVRLHRKKFKAKNRERKSLREKTKKKRRYISFDSKQRN